MALSNTTNEALTKAIDFICDITDFDDPEVTTEKVVMEIVELVFMETQERISPHDVLHSEAFDKW